MICELCLTDSGRTNANLECCKLRAIAGAPYKMQLLLADKMTAAEREEIRPKIVAEKARLRKLRLDKRK